MNIRNHELSMTVLMTPDMANFSGNVTAGPSSSTSTGGLRLRQPLFRQLRGHAVGRPRYLRQPIHVGELVTFLAAVNHTGATSMEIGVKVVTENIQQGPVRHTNSCSLAIVAVDENRKPVEVPPLEPATEDQKRRFEQAAQRREYRKSQGQ